MDLILAAIGFAIWLFWIFAFLAIVGVVMWAFFTFAGWIFKFVAYGLATIFFLMMLITFMAWLL